METPSIIQDSFDALEKQRELIANRTLLWKDLTDHFSSIEKDLQVKSQNLRSKRQSLDFQTQQSLLALNGCASLLIYQLFLYPSISKLMGPITSARVGAVMSIPLLTSYPFMSKLSGIKLSLILNCSSVLKNVLSVTIITGLFILQNNVVHQRGAANGIAMTGQSLFKVVAPAGAGTIFSWAQKLHIASFLPGDHVVFFILNLVELMGRLLTLKPSLVATNIQQET